jgi:Protein of unknown function (DUF2742)
MSRDKGRPEEVGGRKHHQPADTTNTIADPHRNDQAHEHRSGEPRQGRDGAARCVSSQQVSWWSAHEYAAPLLAEAGSWPTVGTPEWCDLAGSDPRKLAAIFDAAQHWALRLETCQQDQCQASRDISAAEDWSAIGREALILRAFYAARPWLKRVAS